MQSLNTTPTIAVVDDDAAIREALDGLILSLGYRSRLFASAEEFLACADLAEIDCLIVDVKMPGLSGLELQERLNSAGDRPPTIFMTSYSDEATRSRAFAGGASNFLGKPVDDEILIRCLGAALAQPGARR